MFRPLRVEYPVPFTTSPLAVTSGEERFVMMQIGVRFWCPRAPSPKFYNDGRLKPKRTWRCNMNSMHFGSLVKCEALTLLALLAPARGETPVFLAGNSVAR